MFLIFFPVLSQVGRLIYTANHLPQGFINLKLFLVTQIIIDFFKSD